MDPIPDFNMGQAKTYSRPLPPPGYNISQDQRPQFDEGHRASPFYNVYEHQPKYTERGNRNDLRGYHTYAPEVYQQRVRGNFIPALSTNPAQIYPSKTYKGGRDFSLHHQAASAHANNYLPFEDIMPPNSGPVRFDDRWIHNSEGMWSTNSQHRSYLTRDNMDGNPILDIYRTPLVSATDVAPNAAYRAHLGILAETVLSAPAVEWDESMRGRRFSTLTNVKRGNGEPCYSVLTVSQIL